jgi:hypothetical protein
VRNTYEIVRHEIFEPSLIEVRGSAFCIEDMFELVGRDHFVCTFVFREGTNGFKEYGRSVTGTVVYSPKQSAILDGSTAAATIEDADVLRIRCLQPYLDQKALDELKYGGVSLSDVEEISYIPFLRPSKSNTDGTKEVPGIIYVELGDTSSVNVDVLFWHLATMKNSSGTELIPYEKERLIGITLGINDGRIALKTLKQLGFDVTQASGNAEIAYHTLVTLQRRGTLTDAQAESLRGISAIRQMKRLQALLSEIKRSGVNSSSLKNELSAVRAIQVSMETFESHVLINGKKQVYWDLEGYLHIAMRHVREMQLGCFRGKTPFPYRAADLETLVEQVLGQIDGEIHQHFAKPPPITSFGRHGKVAVYFNGDYFNVKIDPDGRLVSFHVTAQRIS